MTQSITKRLSIAQCFAALRARKQIGLVPFLPGGYPDLATTTACIQALEAAGAGVIEIGFPFSDPIADGPVIQEAFTATLAKKIRMDQVFEAVAAARASVSLPIVAMVSYSIVYRYGVSRFAKTARQAGFDGLITPDLPPPEAQQVAGAVQAEGLDTILLVAPSTTVERRREIARLSSGFVYYLSVAGITGERDQLPADIGASVRQLRDMTDRPVCVGFGIHKPQHLLQLSGVADGAIVGTAFVRRMKAHVSEGAVMLAEHCATYARELLSEVRPH